VKDGDKHLGPEDLAEREGVTVQTVYQWNKTRSGPRFMKIGRHVRYRLADIVAWEASRTIERTATAAELADESARMRRARYPVTSGRTA